MRKKLSIAQITPYFYPALGGIERTTYEISKRLVERGHKVTVYTSKSKFSEFNVLLDEEVIDGIKVKRFPEHCNIMSTWTPEISEDEDILHLENYCIHPHTYLIAKYSGKKPLVMTPHGGFSRYAGDFPYSATLYGTAKFFWQYLFGKRYLKKIDKLLPLHEWEKENLIAKGAPRGKVEVVSNAIGDEAFKEYKPFKLDKPYILSLTRIARVKSLDHIIRVLPNVPDLYFVVVGGDVGEGEQDRLMELAQELGVSERVLFVGPKGAPEKFEYLRGALAVVVSSSWEMFSSTILEAMAQKVPVIATNKYGNPYIVDHEKTGLIYEYSNLDQLQNAILKLFNNRKLRDQMGENAHVKVWTKYRWPEVIDQLEDIYYSLL